MFLHCCVVLCGVILRGQSSQGMTPQKTPQNKSSFRVRFFHSWLGRMIRRGGPRVLARAQYADTQNLASVSTYLFFYLFIFCFVFVCWNKPRKTILRLLCWHIRGREETFFLSFFLGFRRPNLITGPSGWRTPD